MKFLLPTNDLLTYVPYSTTQEGYEEVGQGDIVRCITLMNVFDHGFLTAHSC